MDVAGVSSMAGGAYASPNSKLRKEMRDNVVREWEEEQRKKKEAELQRAEDAQNGDGNVILEDKKEKRSWKRFFRKSEKS